MCLASSQHIVGACGVKILGCPKRIRGMLGAWGGKGREFTELEMRSVFKPGVGRGLTTGALVHLARDLGTAPAGSRAGPPPPGPAPHPFASQEPVMLPRL